ncbi:MAG: hypothetical protein WCK06_06285, partial [Actinomycetota bacterium]
GSAVGSRQAQFSGGAIAAAPLGLRVARGVVTIPDHRFVEILARGRWWIAVIGVLLIGLVGMQVSLLKLNAGIGESVQRSGLLERANAELKGSISRLGARERLQTEAQRLGLVMPAAGDLHYIRPNVERDAALAAKALRSGAFGPEATAAVAAQATAAADLAAAMAVDAISTDLAPVDAALVDPALAVGTTDQSTPTP